MKILKPLAAALVLAAPASVFAQTYYVERITVYEPARYDAFVAEQHGALHSGAANIEDRLLADTVAVALARDRSLDDITATVSANGGRVTLSGHGSYSDSQRAQQVARRVAGPGSVVGQLSSDLG